MDGHVVAGLIIYGQRHKNTYAIDLHLLTLPEILSISPNMAEIKDDFPLPSEPTIATKLPRGTLKNIETNII